MAYFQFESDDEKRKVNQWGMTKQFEIKLVDLLLVKPPPPPPVVVVPEPEPVPEEPKTNDKVYSNTAAVVIAAISGAGVAFLILVYLVDSTYRMCEAPRESNYHSVKNYDKAPSV